jgi:Uma2 family endonuclease
MSARRLPHRFTVVTYEKMIDLGIHSENDRVELIRGEIVAKTAIPDAHIACVDRLTELLFLSVGRTAKLSIQNPVRLSDSEPEPDVVLKRPRIDHYGKPGPEDILLLIEVAETSLEYDREVKRPLYAEAGIAEFWIVNLIDHCLEVHRQPQPDGNYADVRTLRSGESIELAALPGVTLAVADVVGQ